MYQLAHELEILTKIVKYKNLTQAAEHVGMTQPHLSRVIRKLEDELGVPLMDRSNKRKPEWSQHAPRLVEIFEANRRNLTYQIADYLEDLVPRSIRIGCLEGMVPFVTEFVSAVVSQYECDIVDLVVFDVAKLERRYLTGQLEFLFNISLPGKGHFERVIEIGYQELTKIETRDDIRVCSLFEYNHFIKDKSKKEIRTNIVSNSLAFRQEFFNRHGGYGRLPSPISSSKPRSKQHNTVYFVGSNEIPQSFWQECSKIVTDISKKRV
jgi:DNA-binding transcriptional ArsR family regulator